MGKQKKENEKAITPRSEDYGRWYTDVIADLAQPRGPLGICVATKLTLLRMGVQQRLLNKVRCVNPVLHAGTKMGACQQVQIGAEFFVIGFG